MSIPGQYPEHWPFSRDDFDALDMFYAMKRAWQMKQTGREIDIPGYLEVVGERHGVYGGERSAISDLAFETVYGLLPEHTSDSWNPGTN